MWYLLSYYIDMISSNHILLMLLASRVSFQQVNMRLLDQARTIITSVSAKRHNWGNLELLSLFTVDAKFRDYLDGYPCEGEYRFVYAHVEVYISIGVTGDF